MLNELKNYLAKIEFSPLMEFPEKPILLDLTKGPVKLRRGASAIGKYNEFRPDQYTGSQFQSKDQDHIRNIHLGIDLCAPENTSLYAPYDLKFFDRAYMSGEKDYGYCLLGRFEWEGPALYFILGHLNKASFDSVDFSKTYKRGKKVAELGAEHENGGWFPHVHFQLSFLRPVNCDMPGVTSKNDLVKSLELYPDPRLVLGNLY